MTIRSAIEGKISLSSAPRFSLLLPTHNRADVLQFAIRSVLAQTQEDFELLVVGDGCTDNSADVVTAFGDERIRWFDLPKGPGFGYGNRNVALREAQGEYVGFIAHDDLLFPDHLALCLKAFGHSDVLLVQTRPLWVTDRGYVIPLAFNLENPNICKGFLERNFNAIPASAVMYRRRCQESVGYWDEALLRNGDWDLYARIIQYGGAGSFRFVSEPTVFHFWANWKTAEHKMRGLETWMRFYEQNPDSLPPEICVTVPDHLTEQEVFWQLISAGPNGYCRDLRSAVARVLDQRIHELEALIHTSNLERDDIQSMAEELTRFRKQAQS